MGEVKRMNPKGGLKGKAFVANFLEQFGDEIQAVLIVALNDKGEVIDGWSTECFDDAVTSLGMMEQLKLDFWNTMFEKREDLL